MVRFIGLVILLLIVQNIESDEPYNITKINKKKFLNDLIKLLRNVRGHKKNESSQTRTLKRIAVPHYADQQQPLLTNDRYPISQDVPRDHISYDGKKYDERFHVTEPIDLPTNVTKKSNHLVNKSKKEILLDLLRALKRVQSHKKVQSTRTKSQERNLSTQNSRDKQLQIPLQNDSAVSTLHRPSKERFAGTIIKSDRRSSVVKSTEVLTKTSLSQESKARSSFAQARLILLETLENAQDEKLNKLSQLEKEFSFTLSKSAISNNEEINPTKNPGDSSAKTGAALDNIPTYYENLSRVNDPGALTVHKFSMKGKTFYPTAAVASEVLKNHTSTVRAHFVNGTKRQFGSLLDTDAKSKHITKSGAPFSRPIHAVTSRGRPKSKISSLPEKFTEETFHRESMKGEIEDLGKGENANSTLNKYITTTKYGDKHRYHARLQRRQQNIRLTSPGNKTTPIVDENLRNNTQETRRLQSFSNPMRKTHEEIPENVAVHFTSYKKLPNQAMTSLSEIDSSLHQSMLKDENPPDIRNQSVREKKTENQWRSFTDGSMNKLLKKYPENIMFFASNKYKFHNRTKTLYPERDRGLQQSLGNRENTTSEIDDNVEEKNKKNQRLLSSSGLIREEQNKIQKNVPASFLLNKDNLNEKIPTLASEKVERLRQSLLDLGNTTSEFDKTDSGKNKENQWLPFSNNLTREALKTLAYNSVAPFISTKSTTLGVDPNVQEKNKKNKQLLPPVTFKSPILEGPLPKINRIPSILRYHELNSETGKSQPKTNNALRKTFREHENIMSEGSQSFREENKSNEQVELSNGSIGRIPNRILENEVEKLVSDKYNHSNKPATLHSETGSHWRQSSINHENIVSARKHSTALRNAQRIFLEKVKEIFSQHHRSKQLQNKNHFTSSNNQNYGHNNQEENEIKSSAYAMDGLPSTKPVPRLEIHENTGTVPLTPPNPVITVPENVTSPATQLTSLGNIIAGQALTSLTPGSRFPVGFPPTGNQLSYLQQQEAHQEERVALEQEKAFQNAQNSPPSTMNGDAWQYHTPQIYANNQFGNGNNYPLANAGFQYPNTADISEYRGGMERYQLSHGLGLGYNGNDIESEPARTTHFHHYAQDDEDDENEEDDEQNDDFDDGKKKSHIRKPYNHTRKELHLLSISTIPNNNQDQRLLVTKHKSFPKCKHSAL